MAAEFYIRFMDSSWMAERKQDLIGKVEVLPTSVRNEGNEYWLLGLEDRDSEGRWKFDVRISMEEESQALLEISAHPPSIEHDLKRLFSWLRSRTPLTIVDEDGQPSGW